MRIFDVHSHWGTERGYPLRTPAELAKQNYTWRSDARYVTEEAMAAHFREHDAQVILDLGFTKDLPMPEVRQFHDYVLDTQRRFPDVIAGNWVSFDPRVGAPAVDEFRRCVESSEGFIGLCVAGASVGFPCNDPIFFPLYEASMTFRRPILVTVGYTGRGGGLPGGNGIRLELCHPRYIDDLAARFPELQVIAGRPAWPWQDEMIAVLLHKANVWNELHGWRPKHFTDALKREIPRRLSDKIMFGADYPLLKYDQLVSDWLDLGYDEATMDKVFRRNAQALFGIKRN